jgi:hypothetical protein
LEFVTPDAGEAYPRDDEELTQAGVIGSDLYDVLLGLERAPEQRADSDVDGLGLESSTLPGSRRARRQTQFNSP